MSEFTHWIDVDANVKHVRFSRVAELMAHALHPVQYGNELQALVCGAALVNLECELRNAVDAGALTVLDPLTFGKHPFPIGDALALGLVSVDEIRRFVAPRGIGVRVIPLVGIEARPTEVPRELLELPPTAIVSTKQAFRLYTECSGVTVADCRADIEARMARQAEGYFTVNEAAQVLADSRPGMRAVEWVSEIQQAHRAGVLPIRDAGSRLRMRPLRTTSPKEIPKEWTAVQDMEVDHSDLLLVAELDAWLRDSLGYGFPKPERDNLSAPVATPAAERPQRKTWRDVAFAYVVGRLQAGKFSSAVELNHTLHAEAGCERSPFDKGEGNHRGSLWVREIGQPLKLKTIQNAWQELRTAAGLK